MNSNSAAKPLVPSDEAVRKKAYELWQARGGGHGYEQEDWCVAEMLLQLEAKLHRNLEPPTYRCVQPSEILREARISHAGIREFFSPQNSWIEAATDLETIREFDTNRRLHFDEGFLVATQRIASDVSIQSIATTDHFPYHDLPEMRQKVQRFASLYRNGTSLPPPLFFYPNAYQLEILDGVHRCLAAFHVLKNPEPCSFRIWVGFAQDRFCASQVVQHLWFCSLRRLYYSAPRLNGQSSRSGCL